MVYSHTSPWQKQCLLIILPLITCMCVWVTVMSVILCSYGKRRGYKTHLSEDEGCWTRYHSSVSHNLHSVPVWDGCQRASIIWETPSAIFKMCPTWPMLSWCLRKEGQHWLCHKQLSTWKSCIEYGLLMIDEMLSSQQIRGVFFVMHHGLQQHRTLLWLMSFE